VDAKQKRAQAAFRPLNDGLDIQLKLVYPSF